MALAKYFSKNLLAISQVLKKGSSDDFRETLDKNVIGIAFDDTINSSEGKIAFDLTIRLLSRLYPKLKFIDYSSGSDYQALLALSKSINPDIEHVDEVANVTIVIGSTEHKDNNGNPVFYIGSEGWIAKFSQLSPVGSGSEQNPLGAGFAACVGASNVFRYVFRNFIDDAKFDEHFAFSLLTLEHANTLTKSKGLDFDIGSFTFVGFGAIGNGALWALSYLPKLKGEMFLVEPQKLEATNLQRYILAEDCHIDKCKLDIIKEKFQNHQLQINCVELEWADFISTKLLSPIENVLIAVDNVKDRIAIQSSLPKQITNSYTETDLVGLARHNDFVNAACVMCTYMPTHETRSYSQEVADNLGIPHFENNVRNYLHYNSRADELLLRTVAEANSIDYKELERFVGMPVSEFYGKFVCGGILLHLRKDHQGVQAIEAPLAFQSAMAGILLIADKIATSGKLRPNILPNKTHLYPLQPLLPEINPYSHTFTKDTSKKCICCDKDFTSAYEAKWKSIMISSYIKE